MKKSIQLAAALAAVGLAVSACGSKPATTTSSGSSGASAAASAFKACMVTDTGGLDDHSFNSAAWQGMNDAKTASDGKITIADAQSTTENDYATNISGFVQGGCGIIVTVGYSMDTATVASAKTNTKQDYAIVDNGSTGSNIKGLQFNTAQGAFLGGYIAAGMTKTGKVATFGGQNLPSVAVYMDGFWEGVQYYNTKHSAHVQVLGWNETTQQGTFDPTNSFTDTNGGQQIAQTFQSQGADIVFPVAGGTGVGALAAAKASNGALQVIWVDTDGCQANPTYCGVILGTVTKGIGPAVSSTVEDAQAGKYDASSYIGTLANNGTAFVPGTTLGSSIPAALTAEVATIKTGIEGGSIPITSKNQPTS
ncbi:MAG TPA: BMP family ABC transporter substrate-binding protein [Actinocrinis sp.]|nr:BMP family ABC transporter substrate-binding protein [Actinocrinis sp.]